MNSQFLARRLENGNVKLSIRAAVPTDLPVMMSLEKHAVTAAHWSVEQYDAVFRASGPSRMALVVEVEQQEVEQETGEREMDRRKQIQGFVIAKVVGVEWEIENIAIAGPAQRRGLGTRLLGHVLDVARAKGAESIFLEVRESNHAARLFYEKWSFVESGRRKQYYRGPQEDAILYRREF